MVNDKIFIFFPEKKKTLFKLFCDDLNEKIKPFSGENKKISFIQCLKIGPTFLRFCERTVVMSIQLLPAWQPLADRDDHPLGIIRAPDRWGRRGGCGGRSTYM